MVLGLIKLLTVMHKFSTYRTTFNFIPLTSVNGGGDSSGSTTDDDSSSGASGVHLKDVVVTDCPFTKAPTLTHHKGNNNPAGLKPADTSTGLVLNAIHAGFWLGGQSYLYCQQPLITTNHFDVDSFLSCWCYCNRTLAMANDAVLRHMARVGDFREAFLSPELVAAFGSEDKLGPTMVKEAFTALKLVCWLNTVEKRLFSKPYAVKDCREKFEYFMPRFAAILQDPEVYFEQWQDEYKQVVSGFDLLQGPSCCVEQRRDIGLTIISAPEPQHYYSLFSLSIGFDVVLSMYDYNRYEVECKYTQFVDVHSRPVWPRIDMLALANALNSIETGLPEGLLWGCSRFTDSGPLLRLDLNGVKLEKAQRYGHPTERPHHSSSIAPATLSAIVQSFLECGLAGHKPKRGGWSWDELHSINGSIPWNVWGRTVIEQAERGLLDAPKSSPSTTSFRRRTSLSIPLLPRNSGDLLMPTLAEPSALMSPDDVRALAGAVPAHVMLASGAWTLEYSTARDGVSLHTLYRKAASKSPTLLVVREAGLAGHVFGSFSAEPWRVGSRFYGTGETFVFSLSPQRLQYPWRQRKEVSDFFQFSTHEGLGVGGTGAFAFWLDNDLLEGSSHACATFGSPCLASKEEYGVAAVELWHLA
ncbi:MAG: hypothetical protein WDW38_006273 [Sanguina aurantia]